MKHDLATIIVGILFLLAGIAIGGSMLGYFDFTINFAGWWTVFIIAPALISLIQGGANLGNLIMLSVGIILLLDQQGILPRDFSWKLILPGILLLVGFRLLFGGAGNNGYGTGYWCGCAKGGPNRGKSGGPESRTADDYGKADESAKRAGSASSRKSASVLFGEQNIHYGAEDFFGGTYSALFGECKVNLRSVRLQGDVVITVSAMFGGIELLLPENACLISHVTPILGGTDCKFASSTDPLAPKIIVNGSVFCGGVTIK